MSRGKHLHNSSHTRERATAAVSLSACPLASEDSIQQPHVSLMVQILSQRVSPQASKWISGFEASMIYIVSSKIVRNT